MYTFSQSAAVPQTTDQPVIIANHRMLTVVLMIICGVMMCNWLTFTCLIPALIYSNKVYEKSNILLYLLHDSFTISVVNCCLK